MKMNPELFLHPDDISSCAIIQNSLFFKAAVWLVSFVVMPEKSLRLVLNADGIRVSEEQMPELYRGLKKVCEKFDMEIPELYVKNQEDLFRYYVYDKAYIVISPAVLGVYPSEAIITTLSALCGNILVTKKSNRTALLHVFSVVRNADSKLVSLLMRALQRDLNQYSRVSQISADRFSILYSERPDEVVRACMAAAGEKNPKIPEKEMKQFVDDSFRLMDEYGEHWNRLLDEGRYNWMNYHNPRYAFQKERVVEAIEWAESRDFEKLNRCLNHPDQAEEWPAPFDSDHVSGMDVQTVTRILTDGGFSNISTEKTWRKDPRIPNGRVTRVLIGGDPDYRLGDWYPSGVPVLVEIQKRSGKKKNEELL